MATTDLISREAAVREALRCYRGAQEAVRQCREAEDDFGTLVVESFLMAMAEYAWMSFNENAKVFEGAPQGTQSDPRIHPTQKPVALYAWIFSRYAKPGDKILDTHLGSGSSRIAAWDAGLEFVGCEIDRDYFDAQERRFQAHAAQLNLFLGGGADAD